MFRFGIVLLVVGGFLSYMAYQEWNLGRDATGEPVEIKLKDLIARGPEGNPHVILTDYVTCANIIYETKGSSKSWTQVWVPIVAADDIAVVPGKDITVDRFQAILSSKSVRNLGEIDAVLDKPKLKALVTNKIMSLGDKEQKLLKQNYPGTDFTRCLIIQEGREPASPIKLLLLGGGAGLCLLGGIGCFIVGFAAMK